MNEDIALFWIQESMETAVLLAAPILVTGLLIGLVVSLLQAVTSVQEMTLSYVPKMLAVAILVYLLAPWLMQTLIDFSRQSFQYIPALSP